MENAVIGKVLDDMQSPSFVQQLTAEAKRYAAAQPRDPSRDLRHQFSDLNQRLSRMMDFAASLKDPAPALRKIEELEQQRKLLADEIAQTERKGSTASTPS